MQTTEGVELRVRRLPLRLTASSRRTITRFFWIGEDRARKILARVQGLSEGEANQLVQRTVAEFSGAHPDLPEILAEHYRKVVEQLGEPADHSEVHRMLIGTYFTMEYAHESAALFNPSMVPDRNQDGLPAGSTRFLMSLRAIGEGHVSSIVFRRGTVSSDGEITINPAAQSTRRIERVEDRVYEKPSFREHLKEIGFYNAMVDKLLDRVGEQFAARELLSAAEEEQKEYEQPSVFREAADRVIWLARSNYRIARLRSTDISEVVLFPIAEQESQGMEDMRLVRFTDDRGQHSFYGTYTAFNGSRILPQLMVSSEPGQVEVYALHGRFARNKGLALFPRKVAGQYMMIGRCDAENLYLLRSNSVFNWDEGQLLQCPKYPWEFVQIGNCGSPIETEAGWLVLTHGVGPMRKYCIGAMLLDRSDPAKVLGQLVEPLLLPELDERAGYVPNVVYSCGAMVHNDLLIIPYGISDAATGFATVPVNDLLRALRQRHA